VARRRRRALGIIDGRSGTTYVNDTYRSAYQLICDLVRTCRFCIRYHTKISPDPWPVPLHRHCRCESRRIPPGEKAGNRFVDYAKLYDRLKKSQKVAIVGVANAKLIRAGLISVEDVTSPERVRTLVEVVKAKRLSIKAMVKAGVPSATAKRAYQEARLPGKLLEEQARRRLIFDLELARQSQESLADALAKHRAPAKPRPKIVDLGRNYAERLKAGLDAHTKVVRKVRAAMELRPGRGR